MSRIAIYRLLRVGGGPHHWYPLKRTAGARHRAECVARRGSGGCARRAGPATARDCGGAPRITAPGRECEFTYAGSCRPAARFRHCQQSAALLTQNPARPNVGNGRQATLQHFELDGRFLSGTDAWNLRPAHPPAQHHNTAAADHARKSALALDARLRYFLLHYAHSSAKLRPPNAANTPGRNGRASTRRT
ncbi:hypothetical protein SAMN05216466_12833 [Paraburkholderia phenazinium]|jgi:hypothetical protein|uniref:Uncharacterized protein n=1 Tax=Paraburkholderia phenazinium TaxID=60549 RepID=A0A1G8M449_9BURK|nr:hypothetical protein SAMN05216466_12833 [Paraburkholderia phenazinium]